MTRGITKGAFFSRPSKSAVGAAMLAGLTSCIGGCAHPPNIKVHLDSQLVSNGQPARNIDVDFCGLAPNRTPDHDPQFVPVDTYFQVGSGYRDSTLVKTLHFNSSTTQIEQTLPFKDDIWKTWSKAGVKQFVILSSNPAVGSVDSRRVTLRTTDAFPNDTADVYVRPGKLEIVTLEKK